MKRTIVIAIALLFGLVVAGEAMAHRYGDRHSNRHLNQNGRIQHGIRNGELTCREAGALKKEQWRLERFERRAWADGRLSPWERERLHYRRDRAGERIYRFKHNDYRRW